MSERVCVTLTLEFDREELAALRVLDARGCASETLMHLVGRVVDGVMRPGAWERAWLEQAFGEEWQERLEPDPRAPWRQRPRRIRHRRKSEGEHEYSRGRRMSAHPADSSRLGLRRSNQEGGEVRGTKMLARALVSSAR